MHRNVLVCVTGSVATIKIIEMLKGLQSMGCNLKLVSTQHALHFFKVEDVEKLGIKTYLDPDEWDSWKDRGDPVVHIELRKWADILLIAPLDANTLAKIACGQCDNLLTSVVRAWEIGNKSKSLIVAPSMNTQMWIHPITSKQLKILSEDFGYIVLEPVEKKLVCGDVGNGAMSHIRVILDVVKREEDRINKLEVN